MTFTYEGKINESERDWIRFMIGDTVESKVQLWDEEIQGLLDTYKTQEEAAKKAMERILVILAEKVDHKIGKTSVSSSKLYDNYKKRYDDFVADLNKHNLGVPVTCVGPSIFQVGMNDWR